MVSWGGLGGLAPLRNLRYPCLAPRGGLGGFAPQESPFITRALPPQRPCLAPMPCPQIFSSEKIFDRKIFWPKNFSAEKISAEKFSAEKFIESIDNDDDDLRIKIKKLFFIFTGTLSQVPLPVIVMVGSSRRGLGQRAMQSRTPGRTQ